MPEIINIIKEDTSYDHIVNGDQKTYSECVKKKPSRIYLQSDEHLQSGSQLESLYNQNRGNQIPTETTMEESKQMKQMSHKAPVANSSWQY